MCCRHREVCDLSKYTQHLRVETGFDPLLSCLLGQGWVRPEVGVLHDGQAAGGFWEGGAHSAWVGASSPGS